MKVKCPVCGKTIEWEKNPYRPFCSYRCKMIDLGKWLKEEYRLQDEKHDKANGIDERKKN